MVDLTKKKHVSEYATDKLEDGDKVIAYRSTNAVGDKVFRGDIVEGTAASISDGTSTDLKMYSDKALKDSLNTGAIPIGTAAEIETGTDTTAKLYAPDQLNSAIDSLIETAVPDGTEAQIIAGTDTTERKYTPADINGAVKDIAGAQYTGRTAMKAITGLAAGDVVYLSEGGRSGTFEYLVGDYSAEVAADTLEGVFVALDSDSDGSEGVLKRVFSGDIDAEWFGYSVGTAISDAVNAAISLGFFIGKNTINVPQTAGECFVDKDIIFKQATKLVSTGFSKLFVATTGEGAVWVRNTAGVGIVIDGAAYGERLRFNSMNGISFNGGGLSGDLLKLKKTQNFHMKDVQLFGSLGRTVLIQDMYDSWFDDSYFQTSGTAGSVASFEIDDSAGSPISHNNNIRFRGCTWEANNGQPIYIWGAGTGAGNTQITFDSKCKCENVSVNDYQMKIVDAGAIDFQGMLIVSSGTSGSIGGQVYIENCRNIRGSLDVAHNSGGATLVSVVKLNGYSRCDLELFPAEANVIDGLSGDYIFDNSTGSYDSRSSFSSMYMGSKELITNNTTINQFQPVGIDVPSAAGLRLRRNGGTDSNTAIHIDGDSNGGLYAGKNSSGEFVVSTTSDLDGSAILKVERDGTIVYTKTPSLTVGSAGGAAALPATPSGYLTINVSGTDFLVPYYNA